MATKKGMDAKPHTAERSEQTDRYPTPFTFK
jgi:hypothetical protein